MNIKALDPTARPGTTPRRRAGFTLVEVVMGLALIGVCVGGVASGIMFGLKRAKNAQEELRATQIIAEKFEALRLYTWDQLKYAADFDDPEDAADAFDPDDPHSTGDEPTDFVTPSTFTVPFTVGATNTGDLVYSGAFDASMAAVSETYSNDLIQVTVSLTWPRHGATQSCSATTFFSRYGLQNNIPR